MTKQKNKILLIFSRVNSINLFKDLFYHHVTFKQPKFYQIFENTINVLKFCKTNALLSR